MSRILSKILFTTFITSLFASANALAISFETSTFNPPANSEVGVQAGELEISLNYDQATERMDISALFEENANGYKANFFFLTITDGGAPSGEPQSVVFFDAVSPDEIIVSAYDYMPSDTDEEFRPVIASAEGELVFSTLSQETTPVISASQTNSDTTVRYDLALDSSQIPGVSFGSAIGIWMQSMGLYEEFQTTRSYDSSGALVAIAADISSPGSYGYLDFANATTTLDSTETPEPATAVLLLAGLVGIASFRKKA